MVHTGKEPRDFNIIDDKYVIVGAQEDNKLQVLTFDEENEKLLMTDSELKNMYQKS
jgi:6-phosphogluconolactonase